MKERKNVQIYLKNTSDMFVNMGCVCIRYDKRGTHESTGNIKTAELSNLANDAANDIQYAKKKKLEYFDNEKIIPRSHS
jgi:predicted DNA-binding WGR domain protein